MDQLAVQCPVCTLFLHNGITLESHLDTHPKDQVIKALCSIASNSKSSNYGSRTSTPAHSERSFRSRSRTPATDDSTKWPASRSNEHDRYWRRTPSRTSKSTPLSSTSRNGTPDIRMLDMGFENHGLPGSSVGQHGNNPFLLKADKLQQTFQSPPVPDFDQQFVYYPDQQEDREIKFSRSAEYSAMDSSNNMFPYNVPTMAAPNMKLLPTSSRKAGDLVKVLPKPNNILLKTNMGGVQYIGPGVKPMVMVPSAPTFVQKNVQNNMIMTGGISNPQMQIDTKTVPPPLGSNPLNQMSCTSAFTPGTTVVTQNSQIIYREMVHNIDGKPFITTMPTLLGNENVNNLSQASSMYQNVMVVDQFGNTSCMYTTPQQMMSKACPTSMYNDTGAMMPSISMDKSVQSMNDPKTLIIEVGPLVAPATDNICEDPSSSMSQPVANSPADSTDRSSDNVDAKLEMSGGTKGLKILSNIKVEVPVQHHKNMVNTVMDLTGPSESDYPVERVDSPEKILPDLEDNNQMSSDDTQPSMSSGDSMASHTFSVIKNVGNPSKSSVDNKLDTDFSDSCPVPDLICNEKPSISPCSELSENGDNSTDRTSISPKPVTNQISRSNLALPEKKTQLPQKPYRHNTLRLNNIFVKKHKKVLQIKNAKSLTVSLSKKIEQRDSMASSSSACRTPEKFTMNKMHQTDKTDCKEKSNLLQTISVEEIKEGDENNDFDADTEEQSMDIEQVEAGSLNQSEFGGNMDLIQVKEEINSSNEGAFSNETMTPSDRMLNSIDSLRPINVINYGNMSNEGFNEEANDRELLNLEGTSKTKQFVNMMNENYFGDNIYADYFTPDRVEAFDAEREAASFKDGGKDGARDVQADVEVDGCEPDSKADVLSESRSDSDAPLNICADERMPPRGELSGQESNGDMESPWSGMYSEVTPSEPYDLIARESWASASDGSDVDANDKEPMLVIDEDVPIATPSPAVVNANRAAAGGAGRAGRGGRGAGGAGGAGRARAGASGARARRHTCGTCGASVATLKELRAHKALLHAAPHAPASYSRLVTARAIMKEEKPDDTNNLLTPIDSKDSISSSILQVYENIQVEEAKPKIEVDRLIKQEVKRKRKDYVCPTCKVDQVTETLFHEHLKIHPLECLTCGKCFFRRANLALHIKTHLGIKNYKCEVCEKRFLTRQKLMEHHNVHTGRAPVKCTLCDDTFRRYSNMVQHRDRHHLHKRSKVRDFVCQCGLVLHSRAKLRWHQETHADRPRACDYCSDKFVHAASLTRHIRRAHNQYFLADRLQGNNENVQCPVCKQVYLRSNLRTHLQTHSGQRPFVCIICNKSFTTKWNLKLHRWTHMSRSSKPFKCNLCKGAFIRQSEYISHMNAHKSVRPYTCNYCGCQFIRKYNCQRHVREHESAKKYVCKVAECGKSFHRSYYLAEHMKVHSGARPFACAVCGKTSSNKSNHNKHVKIHHAREPVATEA
ncbi:uncharacterized protein LOC118269555 isoform X2 [Spodoptera frugiperda]|uniref:Uncharacterized protein LOC118269555 isoform X2 n=1 Tax=Spodoptera frugiperda TaxID=7108 RepID=A0A9R0D5I2_SPOFR|nr:uncharacterized protein LOC118269555 isoform X2 [Spodoptera frugiperda]